MMKKLLILSLSLLMGLSALAQEEFILPSETYLFAERDTCSLYMDIFRPAEGAETSLDGIAKPTIVYVFGGGFVMGQRTDDFTSGWYRLLTENGYSVVSIDYRLGMKGQQVGKGIKGAFQAASLFHNAQQLGVEDVFSAISFLHENREELGIDTDNLVLAGSSAGAIISLAAAYDIACGRTEGLPDGFQLKGVMSFAGAIISLEGAPRFPSAPCPILLLHGTKDKIVAYKGLNAFGLGLWGSVFLDKQLDRMKASHRFYRIKDRRHDVAAYMEVLWPQEKEFLEQDVILGRGSIVDEVVNDPSLPEWTDISDLTLDNIYRK